MADIFDQVAASPSQNAAPSPAASPAPSAVSQGAPSASYQPPSGGDIFDQVASGTGPRPTPDHYRQAGEAPAASLHWQKPVEMARQSGVSDDEILDYVGRFEPQLASSIAQAKAAGRNSTDLLDKLSTTGDLGSPAGPPVNPNTSPVKDALTGYGKGVASQLNPKTIVQGVDQAFYHPIDAAKNILATQGHLYDEAANSFQSGDYKEGLKHGLLYLLPLLGPQMDAMSNKAEQGHLPEALGEATGAGLLNSVGESPLVRSGLGKAANAAAQLPGVSSVVDGAGRASDAIDNAITGARNNAADSLRNSADKNYETALNPTTKINKALTQDQLAPGLRERGVTATSLNDLQGQAQGHIEDLGSQIDDAFEQHADAGTKVSAQPILQKLEQEKQGYIVDGVPINEAYVNRIGGLQKQLANVASANGGDLPLDSLRRIRQIHDKTIAQSKGGFALSPDDASHVDALKTYTDAIRSTIAGTDPILAKVNKEFSFWKNVDKVTGESLLRKTGQRGPLTQKIMQTGGAVLGSHFGPVGTAVGIEAGGRLSQLQHSALWNTFSAQAKAKIASLIEAGDEAGAVQLMQHPESTPAPAGLLGGKTQGPVAGPGAEPLVTSAPAGSFPESGSLPRQYPVGSGTNRMLPPPSRIQSPGFAVGDDLVAVKDPSTGQYVYVPRWTLQENASPIRTTPEPDPVPATAALAKDGVSVPASGHDEQSVNDDTGRSGPDVRTTEARPGRGVLDDGEFHQPDDGNGSAQAKSGGVEKKRSGAQIDADRLMAEAKAHAAAKDKAQSGVENRTEDEGDVPTARMMRPFPDVPFDKRSATRREVLDGSQVFYRPGRGGFSGVVYVNDQARELLTHVGGATDDDAFEGLYMPPALARNVIKKLDGSVLKNSFGIRAAKPLFALRQALSKALKENGSVILADGGPGQTLANVKASIRHELHHAYEKDFSPEQAADFMQDPLAHKAGRTLVGDDPQHPRYDDEPVNLTSEIGAHLQGDPSGKALDLTPAQADQLWRRYVRHYPGEFRFERMHPTLKKAAREELNSQGRPSILGE